MKKNTEIPTDTQPGAPDIDADPLQQTELVLRRAARDYKLAARAAAGAGLESDDPRVVAALLSYLRIENLDITVGAGLDLLCEQPAFTYRTNAEGDPIGGLRSTMEYDSNPDLPEEISMFLHCKKCLDERPGNQSPKQWARVQVGYHPKGLQIWCNRHDINVAVIEAGIERIEDSKKDS